MTETTPEIRQLCVLFNTKLNRFLVYDKNIPTNLRLALPLSKPSKTEHRLGQLLIFSSFFFFLQPSSINILPTTFI